MARKNMWGLWGGITLIGLGLVTLLGQLLRVNMWSFVWPLFIIAIGLAFFAGMMAGGRATGPLALPGSVLTTIGLILFVQNALNIWATWAYAWGLVIAGAGIGMIIFGRHSSLPELARAGRITLIVGLGLFFVFGTFFELGAALFGLRSMGGLLWPLVLILAGIYFLIGRPLLQQWSGPVSRSDMNFNRSGAAGVQAITTDAPGTDLTPAPNIEEGVAVGVRRVSFHSVGDLTIYQGEREALEVEANQALRERIQTTLRGDKLEIRLSNTWLDWLNPRYWNIETVRYSLYLRDLSFLEASGLGDTRVLELNTGRLELVHNGAGNVTVSKLTVNDLSVRQAGLGDIKVAGQADRQEVELSGVGNYKAGELQSQAARVQLSGLGNATVWAAVELEGQISGVGNIEVYGSPRITERTSGLGKVRRLGQK